MSIKRVLRPFAGVVPRPIAGGTGPVTRAPLGPGGGSAGGPAAGSGRGRSIPLGRDSNSLSYSGRGGAPVGPAPTGPTTGSPVAGVVYPGQLNSSAIDVSGPPKPSVVPEISDPTFPETAPFTDELNFADGVPFIDALIQQQTSHVDLGEEYFRVDPTLSEILNSLNPVRAVGSAPPVPEMFGVTPKRQQVQPLVTYVPGDSVSKAPSGMNLSTTPSPSPPEHPAPGGDTT